MEWPNPQPGHHLNPSNFRGHKLKCAWPFGLVKARQMRPAIQNTSSKYRSNNRLINFVPFIGKQYRHAQRKQHTHQQGAEYPFGKNH